MFKIDIWQVECWLLTDRIRAPKSDNKTTKFLAAGIWEDVKLVQDNTEDNITAIISPVLIILSVS